MTDRTTNAGAFLSRQLEQRLPKVLERRYRDLPFENGSLIPTMSDLQPGAASLIQEQIDSVGDAAMVSDEAFDIPLADIKAEENEFKIIAIYSGFHWTFRQLQAAEKGGRPLQDLKMFAAKRAISEKMNKIAAFGEAKYGLTGMVNHPDVPLNNSSFNPNTATADDLIGFFLDETISIVDSTEATEAPNIALVSIKMHNALIKKRIPDTNMNVKSYILDNSSYLTDIRPIVELASPYLEKNGVQAGGTNKDRMILYPLNEETLERHIEQIKPMPQEYRNGRYIVPMYACTSPVLINFPKAMRYVDFVKAA